MWRTYKHSLLFAPSLPELIEDIENRACFRNSRETWNREFSKIEKLRENKLIPAIAEFCVNFRFNIIFYHLLFSLQNLLIICILCFKLFDTLGNRISSLFPIKSISLYGVTLLVCDFKLLGFSLELERKHFSLGSRIFYGFCIN